MVVSRWGAVAAGSVAVAVIAGVTVGGAAAGASTHARNAVSFSVAKSGAIRGPGHLAPGRIKIKIHGAKSEAFQLVRSRHGAGKAQLLADAAEINSQQPNPLPIERDFVLAGGTQVGYALYVTLTRGTYYAVDVNVEGPQPASNVREIVVSGKKKTARFPSTSGTITAVGSESWSNKPKSIPHQGVLRFVNKANQPHFMVLTRLKKGAKKKDILPALTGKTKASKVFYTSAKNSLDIGVVSPRGSMRTTFSLPKGRYAVLCFWPDPKTHMPHAFMGMIRIITLR